MCESGCGKGVTGPLLSLEGSGDLPGKDCDLRGPEKCYIIKNAQLN